MSNFKAFEIRMEDSYEDRIFRLMADFRVFGVDFSDSTQEMINDRIFYYSVPEKTMTSIFSMDGEEYKKFIKNKLIDLIVSGVDSTDEKFLKECKEHLLQTVKCFSKIRHGDYWTDSKVFAMLDEMKNEVSEYGEI